MKALVAGAAFYRLEEALAGRGFARCVRSDVICRWRHRESGLLFDLMPVDDEVLGFSNPRYADAVETARPMEIAEEERAGVVQARMERMSR